MNMVNLLSGRSRPSASEPKVGQAQGSTRRTPILPLVWAVMTLCSLCPGNAHGCEDYPAMLRTWGQVDTPGEAWAAAVVGDHALVADLSGGLQVVDVSDPADPGIVASLSLDGDCRSIGVRDVVACVLAYDWLHVIDVQTPRAPQLLGSIATRGESRDVAVAPGLAYVADGPWGLSVYDISAPEAMQLLATLSLPEYAMAVALQGNLAVVAMEWGLAVIDVGDPQNPTLRSVADICCPAYDVTLRDGLAYLAGAEFGIAIVDLTDPDSPQVRDWVAMQDNAAVGVDLIGTRAYIAGEAAGISVVDVRDPEHIQTILRHDTPGTVRGLAAMGDHVVTCSGDHGIVIVGPEVTYGDLDLLGSAPLESMGRDVAVSYPYAYIADYIRGFKVMDISDPSSPEIIANVSTPGTCIGVAVQGAFAYVAASEWILVYDVGSPGSPSLIGSHHGGNAQCVVVSGNLLCATGYSRDLRVFDISNPAAPMLLDTVSFPDPLMTVAMAESYVYAGDWGTVNVVDASDPSDLQVLGRYPCVAYKFVRQGNYLYAAQMNSNPGATDGLGIFDISDRAHPVEVGNLATDGAMADVAVVGRMAYLACGDGEGPNVQAVDVSDPTNPALVGTLDTGALDLTYGIAAQDTLICAVGSRTGAHVVSHPRSTPEPRFVGQLLVSGGARDVAVVGNLAYVGTTEMFVVADVSDPTDPRTLAAIPTPDDAWAVDVSGDHAYVAVRGTGLLVIDVSNPAAPSILAVADTPGEAWDVAAAGSIVYVPDGPDGLLAFDVADPSAPVLAGSLDMEEWCTSVALAGNRAYVTNGNAGLAVVDISDPAHMSLIHETDTPGTAFRVALSSGLAFVADGDDMAVLDISDPDLPILRGIAWAPGWARAVAASGRHAYLADEWSGLCVIDARDPDDPRVVAGVAMASDPLGITRAGDCVYIVGGEEGLLVAPAQCYESAAVPEARRRCALELLQISPNPVGASAEIEWRLVRAERVRLAVYDVTGREVIRLVDRPFSPGLGAVSWDGRDRHGRRVSQGVYALRLETSAGDAIRKFTIMR